MKFGSRENAEAVGNHGRYAEASSADSLRLVCTHSTLEAAASIAIATLLDFAASIATFAATGLEVAVSLAMGVASTALGALTVAVASQ